MVNFENDESLGKTVKSTTLFCTIGVKPITDVQTLGFAAGNRKFSRLCGFDFVSANDAQENPVFSISFVNKIRSKIYHKASQNPSQWFIFKKIDAVRVDVLDKNALLVNYGFDIDQFFKSDLFKSSVSKFKQIIAKGLEDARKFADSCKDTTDKRLANSYISSLEPSITLISQPQFNNKYYKLVDMDVGVDYGKETIIREEAVDPRYACEVVKAREGGKVVYKVQYVQGKSWLATFQDEAAAVQFADEYPAMRQAYDKQAATIGVEENPQAINEYENSPLIRGTNVKKADSSTANSFDQDGVVGTEIDNPNDGKSLDKKIELALSKIY